MARCLKIFLGILLAVNIIFTASFALALELSYPDIPGLGRLSDYQSLEQSQQIGFIISYVFKLVFFIAIGAGLVALLASGVFYIVSSSRPKYLITAKQMANNAMLGLFILLCAYLFLYFINPQLLSLTLNKPKIDKFESSTANQYDPNTVVAQKVSFTEILLSAVSNLEEKVYKYQGHYVEKIQAKNGMQWCFTDGYGGATRWDGTYLRDLPDTENDKINGCFVPPAGFVINEKTDFIYRAEIPLRETAAALKIVAPSAAELSELLDKCKCGQSFGWSDWSTASPGCKPGLNPAEYRATVKENTDSGNYCFNQADNCGTKKLTADRGNKYYLDCDTRDVRKNLQTGVLEVCMKDDKNSNINKALPLPCTDGSCWVSLSSALNGFIDAQRDCGIIGSKVDNLIKLKILKIQEQQAKIQARSKIDSRFLDSATLIAKALDANSMEFSTGQAKGYWAYDFAEKLKQLQSAGYNVVIKDAKSSGTASTPISFNNDSNNNGFFARLKSFFSPFTLITSKFTTSFAFAQDKNQYFAEYAGTFFYITNAPEDVQSKEITDKNKAIARDAGRYNLFSLLTDLPLEGIEGIFRDCLTAAFGTAQYQLDEDQVKDVVKAVMETGAGEHLKEAIRKKIDEIALATIDGTKQSINDDATAALVKKYLIQCTEAGCGTTDADAQKYMDDLFGVGKKCSVVTNSCCYCVKSLMSNGVPPNYLSKKLSNLFSTNLDQQLSNIGNLLDKTIIETLFPPNEKIGQVLNGPMLNVYDAIFKNVLTEDFNKQVPGLDSLLNKQMKDVLPDFMVDQIVKINTWFENTVSSTKSLAKSASDKLEKGLVDEFVAQPMHEWAQNQFDKLGIGTEHLTIGACFEKFANNQGYIYKTNSGKIKTTKADFIGKTEADSGKCVLMTTDEINMLSRGEIDVPQSFVFENSTDLSATAKIKDVKYFDGKVAAQSVQATCEGAGYAWEGGDGGSGCWKKDDIAKDAQAAIDTISDIDKTKTYIAGGLVSYAEKLSVAFAETALQFALAYARVFVEDNFITPLLSYWNTISGFQKGMEDFLGTSVKGLLPAQISGFLQSNIADQVEQFCEKYKDSSNSKKYGPGTENGDCPANSAGITGECTQIDLVFILPSGTTWKDSDKVVQTVTVAKETGDAICKIDKAFKTSAWEEITMMCERNKNAKEEDKVLFETKLCNNVIQTLQTPLGEALQNVCEKVAGVDTEECKFDKLFAKPLVSIFFPHLPFATIDAFIKGTPKDLICGDLPVLSGGTTKATTLCANAFDNKYGFFPQIKNTLTKSQKDIMPWCFFINYACKNPLTIQTSNSTPKIGDFIKTAVDTSCDILDKQSSNPIGGCYCKYDCPKNNIASPQPAGVCTLCNTLAKNSIFYSLLYASVSGYDQTASDRTPEIKFYADMFNYFPDFSADIMAVVKNRGIIKTEQEIKNQVGFGVSSLVNLFIKGAGIRNATIKDMLKKDEILGKTLSGAIEQTVCNKQVIPQFEAKYPQRTLESLEGKGIENIISALPYSLEAVETISFAEVVRAFNNTNEGKSDLGSAYLFCKILDKTPQELAGLDFPLKSYIKPDEFKILFELLNNELSEGSEADCQDGENFFYENGQGICCDSSGGIGRGVCYKVGERPAGLNLLLDYMDNKTPISALEDVQQKINHPNDVFIVLFYVSDTGKCLKVGSAIRGSCSGTIPSTFDSFGFDSNNKIQASSQEIVLNESSVVSTIQAFGKISKEESFGGVKIQRDYFLYREPQSGLVFVFKGANQTANQFKQVLEFMQTPVKDILDGVLGATVLADYICPQAWCNEEINESWRLKYYNELKNILSKTPVDLAAIYLTDSFSLPEMFKKKKGGQDNISIMDAIAKNTAFDQPFIDTFGALTGLDELIQNNIGDPIAKKISWVDNGAKAGVKAIQNGLETALVDWPTGVAPQWLAEFYGLNVGKKAAKDIAGSCYDKEGATSNNSCNEGEIFKPASNAQSKPQCCVLAKGESCQPRCREVDLKLKQCNVLAGEMPTPIRIPGDTTAMACCFGGVIDLNDPTPIGFWLTGGEPIIESSCGPKPADGCPEGKIERPSNNNQCCSPQIKFCEKARAVNFDAGAKCREKNEAGGSYEVPDREKNTCVFLETYKQTLPPLPSNTNPTVEDMGSCCSTVSQCITNRLSSHLETLAEMMANGNIPLSHLNK